MRIYFIGQKGIPTKSGGVEKYVEALATNLVKNGQEVFVYTRPYYTNRKLTEYQGVKLISRPSCPTKHLDTFTHTLVCTLDVLFRRADIVHFQAIGPASLLWIVKIFKPKTKVIFTFHCQNYQHNKKWGRLARLYLHLGEIIGCRLADEVITVSRGLTSYVKEKYGREVNYIPNGANVVDDSVNSDILSQLGLESQTYILVVTRLVRHKGLHCLIRAFQKLDTDSKLVIVGDEAYTEDYASQLIKLSQNDPRIIFTGERLGNDLAQLFRGARLFVQPSESEGLSIALLEAMAYGVPVLVSDIPANLEVIGDCGWSFRSSDVDDLAAKLRECLDNPDRTSQFVEAAQRRIKAEYNWHDITNRTLQIYGLSQV